MLGDVNFHSGFVVRIGSADIHETVSGFPSSSTSFDNVNKNLIFFFFNNLKFLLACHSSKISIEGC